MKKKKSVKTGIIVAVLLLAVGFAAVTTTLYINGTAIIKPNDQDFRDNVIFASAAMTFSDASVTEITQPQIVDDGKSITFTTPSLKSIGDTATIQYTIQNNSQYKAQLTDMVCKIVDGAAAPADMTGAAAVVTSTEGHVRVTAANSLMASEETKIINRNATTGEDTLKVEMIKSFAGTEEADFKTYTIKCQLDVNAVEDGATTTTTSNAAGE